MNEIKLTERQVKAVLDVLCAFSSERAFAEKKHPSPTAMSDFAIYMKECAADADIEAVREVVLTLRSLLK